MARLVALTVAPLLLSSCLWPILGDPGIANTEYVVTGSASDAHHACDIVRDVAAANGLRSMRAIQGRMSATTGTEMLTAWQAFR
jgi:hypothetical protein